MSDSLPPFKPTPIAPDPVYSASIHIPSSRERLRDEFAMAALTGLLGCSETAGDMRCFASESYDLADAMLEVRERKED